MEEKVIDLTQCDDNELVVKHSAKLKKDCLLILTTKPSSSSSSLSNSGEESSGSSHNSNVRNNLVSNITKHSSLSSSSSSLSNDEARIFGNRCKHNERKRVVTSNKTAAAEERQAKKQKLQEEKLVKLAAMEKEKIYKPGECMKYMTIEIHPVLASAWYMSDVSREAAAAGCRVSTESSLCDPALVMWTRSLQPKLTVNSDRQVGLSSWERCSQALYVCEANTVAELVHDHKLAQHMAHVRDVTACQLTLIVFGVKDYFKTSKRKTMNSNRKLMTEVDLEMALTDLIVSVGCDGLLADTPNHVALIVMQFTKAVAEAPFKLAKRAVDEQSGFYLRGDKRNALALDEDGNGVVRLWQQMIATLPNSSLETARSLCGVYKSPLVLFEALNEPNSIKELSSLPVVRAALPSARGRRLGPEFARRLHTLFTAEDGDMLIE